MARRLFNGRQFSEDGWPYVDQGSCTWVTIPGTAVTLQIQNGQCLTILRAFAADYNAHVEPLRDADSGCWTPGNSVATSNHPGGTSMDLNWDGPDGKTFRYGIPEERAYPGDKARNVRDLLDFYEGMIFCGGFWSIRDWMHFQMGGDTYDQRNDRPQPKVGDFIARKIRADGFSTYKRGNATMPPSDAADVLMRATGITHDKAWDIMVGVINGLRDSECNNVNRIAMWLAQIGHESAGFNATEEYQSGDESTDRWKYKGRTWIQITWESNYAGLSEWAFGKGLIPSPTYFVDNPKKLADIQYAGLGPAWYWVVARPQINSLCDQRNLTAVTQAINGGQNGAADRKRRYDMALALGDQLLTLTSPAQGDDMAAVPQDQWDRVYRELTQRLPSRSPLRYLDQNKHYPDGLVDTMAGFELNVDGMTHVQYVTLLASYNHPPTMALLNEVAGGDPAKYPDRADDIKLAQAVLNKVAADKVGKAVASSSSPVVVNGSVTQAQVQQIASAVSAAASAVTAQQAAAPVTVGGTTGQLIGQAFDSLEALKGAQSDLSPQAKATVDALIGVLQAETGVPA